MSRTKSAIDLSSRPVGAPSGVNEPEKVIGQVEECLPEAMAGALGEHQEEQAAAVVGHRHQRTPGTEKVACLRCGSSHFHRGKLQLVSILTGKGTVYMNSPAA